MSTVRKQDEDAGGMDEENDESTSQQYWLDQILGFVEDTRPLFLNDQETMRLYDIEQNLISIDDARARELDVTRERLRALSRQAEAYKLSAQRPPNAATEKEHESRLVELDAKKYGLAKTIADLEQAISSAELNLARAKDEAGRVEREDPVQASQGSIADALKLAIYRNMGFVPVEEAGRYTRMLIKSDSSKDVHSLSLHPASTSHFDLVQQAWSLAK